MDQVAVTADGLMTALMVHMWLADFAVHRLQETVKSRTRLKFAPSCVLVPEVEGHGVFCAWNANAVNRLLYCF
ncbi:MAG: hypothetical protein AAFV29_26710, partial [Myxococcota bacterium]